MRRISIAVEMRIFGLERIKIRRVMYADVWQVWSPLVNRAAVSDDSRLGGIFSKDLKVAHSAGSHGLGVKIV